MFLFIFSAAGFMKKGCCVSFHISFLIERFAFFLREASCGVKC